MAQLAAATSSRAWSIPALTPRLPPILVGPFLDPPETRHDGQQDESRGEGSPFPCAETLDLGDVIGHLEAVLDDNLFHALHRRRFLAGQRVLGPGLGIGRERLRGGGGRFADLSRNRFVEGVEILQRDEEDPDRVGLGEVQRVADPDQLLAFLIGGLAAEKGLPDPGTCGWCRLPLQSAGVDRSGCRE